MYLEQDENAVRYCVENILRAIGENPQREGLMGTPERVARMYGEIFEGYNIDPAELLKRSFAESDNYGQLVMVRNIEFYSHCEHHMVPFFGKAHVGYIPTEGHVIGISKFARLVECYAKRLQIQERMTMQIANTIEQCASPLGVMVVIEAEHLCMKMRGIKNPCADTVTSAAKGVFLKEPEARAEFLSLMRKG